MADAYTSTETFIPKSEPVTVTATSTPFFPGVDAAAFAERSRLGRLDANDDQARVNGYLGGTKDPVDLSIKITAATGGHDDVWPVTNPEPPAVYAEAPLHPGIDPALVLQRDLDRANAAHEAAKAA